MKLLRSLRGPFWYVFNVLSDCWRFNLQDIIDRPGQTPLKRFMYRCVITVETLLEGVFLMAVVVVLAAVLMAYVPTRWVYGELRETWT